jgi:hypothetical protein
MQQSVVAEAPKAQLLNGHAKYCTAASSFHSRFGQRHECTKLRTKMYAFDLLCAADDGLSPGLQCICSLALPIFDTGYKLPTNTPDSTQLQ